MNNHRAWLLQHMGLNYLADHVPEFCSAEICPPCLYDHHDFMHPLFDMNSIFPFTGKQRTQWSCQCLLHISRRLDILFQIITIRNTFLKNTICVEFLGFRAEKRARQASLLRANRWELQRSEKEDVITPDKVGWQSLLGHWETRSCLYSPWLLTAISQNEIITVTQTRQFKVHSYAPALLPHLSLHLGFTGLTFVEKCLVIGSGMIRMYEIYCTWLLKFTCRLLSISKAREEMWDAGDLGSFLLTKCSSCVPPFYCQTNIPS